MTVLIKTEISSLIRNLPTAIKQSWALVIAIPFSQFLSYLFQFFMSRNLSAAEFGLLNGLMAFSVLLTVPISAIRLTVARQAAETVVREGYEQVCRYLRTDLRQATPFILIGFLGYLLFSRLLASFFHASLTSIWLVGVGALISLYCPFGEGVLQGMQWFQSLAGTILVRYLGKVALGVLLVAIGLKVEGALAALALSTLGAALYAFAVVGFSRGGVQLGSEASAESRDIEGKDMGPTLVTYTSIIILTNLDLPLARHYLPPSDSANYAIAALLGKIAYYLPNFVSLMIVPKVASAYALRRPTKRYFWAGLASVVALSAAVVLVCGLFPQQTISILFSGKYASLETAWLVFYYSLVMLVLSILYFEVHYLLALRYTQPLWALLVAPIVSLAGMILWHSNGFELINALLLGLLSGLLAINFVLLVGKGRRASS